MSAAGAGVPKPGPDRTAARRAALLVHALSAPDRQWLLTQLPPGERERLQSLLDEIRRLGIPDQPELLEGLLAATRPGRSATASASVAAPIAAAPAHAVSPADSQSSDLEQLDRAVQALAPPRIAGLLRDEPRALADRVLARLGNEQRRAVRRRLQVASRPGRESASPRPHEALPGDGSRIDRAVLSALLRRACEGQTAESLERSASAWLTRPWLRTPLRSAPNSRSSA